MRATEPGRPDVRQLARDVERRAHEDALLDALDDGPLERTQNGRERQGSQHEQRHHEQRLPQAAEGNRRDHGLHPERRGSDDAEATRYRIGSSPLQLRSGTTPARRMDRAPADGSGTLLARRTHIARRRGRMSWPQCRAQQNSTAERVGHVWQMKSRP